MKSWQWLLSLAVVSTAAAGELLFPDNYQDLSKWYKSNATVKIEKVATPGATAWVKITSPGYVTRIYQFDWQTRQNWSRQYTGLSFKVRGDGSPYWGCLSIGMGWGWMYSYYFPLSNKKWQTYQVAWSDFMPAYNSLCKLIAGPSSVPPDGLNSLRLGDRWRITHNNTRMKPYSYEIADIRLTDQARPELELDRHKMPSFAEFKSKLQSRNRVEILCLGDSITAGTGLRYPDMERYAEVLGKMLKKNLRRSNITAYSRAVGGAALSDTLRWLNRDLDGVAPDLITLMIGYNAITGGNDPSVFQKQLELWVRRVIAKTRGQATILLIPTIPGREFRYAMHDDYAQVVRNVAKKFQLPVCPVDLELKKLPRAKFDTLFKDRAHPNADGHKLIAKILFDFLTAR